MKFKFAVIIFQFNAQPGRHKIVDEEKRFKHKLNMLEPGSRILSIVGLAVVTKISDALMKRRKNITVRL